MQMKTTTLFSTILLAAAAVSGCERREAGERRESTVEEQRADREAFTSKARERLRQLDTRINEVEKTSADKLRQLTQQAKVAADDDDKKDIAGREKKLRDKVNDEVADLKRERNDLKADIDSIEMRAYEDWDDAKKDVNKAFDRLEEDVDDLAKDIDKEGGKAIDKTKKVLRDEKRDVEERRTHD
jgi:hypothetical protein